MLHMLSRGMTREAGGAFDKMKPSMRADAWEASSLSPTESSQCKCSKRNEATPMNLFPATSATFALLQPESKREFGKMCNAVVRLR